jgi:hypothetical protein
VTSENLVLDRQSTTTTRVYGLVFTLGPAAAGAWLLARGGGVNTAIGVAGLVMALLVLRTNLRFARRVAIEGDRARVTSLWIGGRELDLRQLSEIRIRPELKPRPEGGAPRLDPATYNLGLADGERLFLGAADFPGAERLVTRAMRVPAEGFAFPVKLASACLVNWTRFVDDPRLGCSASYAVEGGTLSIYVYRGDTAELPDGAESDAIEAELSKAAGDVIAMAGRTSTPVRELERGRLGGFRRASFELGDRRSLLYLTAQGGRFVKARFTGPDEAEPRVAESLGALAAEAW